MIFNEHYELEGKHAFLGASKYHWINYDAQKLRNAYIKHQAVYRGTVLHDFAKQCILLKQNLPRSKKTLNLYVNDAIRYEMQPEQVLYFSHDCFGTADAISFNNDFLRIHDLKTGSTPAHMEQLEIYAALFCLEYSASPHAINMELRIYQNNEILIHVPEPDAIEDIMNKIVEFTYELNDLEREYGYI